MKGLHFNKYAADIRLFDDYLPEIFELNSKEDLVDSLLEELNQQENPASDYPEKRRLLHGVINTLQPNTLSKVGVKKLNALLRLELEDKQITSLENLLAMDGPRLNGTKIVVWKGDIATLAIDAIVNAANNQLLGCWHPLHMCIDNVIHTAAGVQLRDDCNLIMKKQGYPEPTGAAKVTRAYNLPSKFVLHTVGPIVGGRVEREHEIDLAGCYTSCLEICKEMDPIKSIAFCGISTGVFGYPADQASNVAFRTVANWLERNPGELDLMVFNVFSDNDRTIYDNLVMAND